jgi:hypothetical protein
MTSEIETSVSASMPAPYVIDELPVVDPSADTAKLAAQILKHSRTVGIRPWTPESEPAFQYPSWKQHASAHDNPGMVFGQYVDGTSLLLTLPEPEPWRLVAGSFLLGGMAGHGKSCANWMLRSRGDAGGDS